jgi:hypothetical protein
MRILRAHVDALSSTPDLIASTERTQLEIVVRALDGGMGARIAALRMPGFARQTFAENLIFRLWFVLG